MKSIEEVDIDQLHAVAETLEDMAKEKAATIEAMTPGFTDKLHDHIARIRGSIDTALAEDQPEEVIKAKYAELIGALEGLLSIQDEDPLAHRLRQFEQEHGVRATDLSMDDPRLMEIHEFNRVLQPGLQLKDYMLSLPGRRLEHEQKLGYVRATHSRPVAWMFDRVYRPRPLPAGNPRVRMARRSLKEHHGVLFMESDATHNGEQLKAPLRHLKLRHLGVFDRGFVNEMRPAFNGFEWDTYDVKRKWLEAILEHVPESAEHIDRLKSFYYGEIERDGIQKFIDQLPDDIVANLERVRPWRKRAIAKYKAGKTEDGLAVERVELDEFTQPDGDLIRSWPRRFNEIGDDIESNPQFQKLLREVVDAICHMDKGVEEVEMTAHFMGVAATAEQEGDNAPEGLHQDGADYIISALVIERDNIQGGESVISIREPDGTDTEVYRGIVKTGEFLLQADVASGELYGADNEYWHTVTPFKVINPLRPGVRNIIGFDIVVTKRKEF